MLFVQLKALITSSEVELIRADDKDYLEAVILKDKLAKLIEKIEPAFGSPKLPSDSGLTVQAQKVINDLGGVRGNQTLYVLNTESSFILIMFWPWGDGQRVTLKIYQR